MKEKLLKSLTNDEIIILDITCYFNTLSRQRHGKIVIEKEEY